MDHSEEVGMDEIIEQHSSDNVFDDLVDGIRPEPIEWSDLPGYLFLACGCNVFVEPGDTVWFIAGPVEGALSPVALDPRTVH